MELRNVEALHRLLARHVAEQHLHRHQVDEDQPLVLHELPVAVVEGERQVLVGGFVVRVVHRFASDEVLVSDLLGEREGLLEGQAFDGADERLTQVQLVDSKINFEHLIDEVQHAQSLRVALLGSVVGGAHAEAGHEALRSLLHHLAALARRLDGLAFECEQSQVQARRVHDRQAPIFLFYRLQQLHHGVHTRTLARVRLVVIWS